jgi:hypothetical protein
MALSSTEFLERACQRAYENGTLFVQDDSLLPELKAAGVSDAALHRIKQDLEDRGDLTNHRVVGGFADFSLDRRVFLNYAKRRIPSHTLGKAQQLFDQWKRQGAADGPFTAEYLSQKLNIPDPPARYLVELLT